jgi:hypothetical protein
MMQKSSRVKLIQGMVVGAILSLVIFGVLANISSCRAIKPYEKEYLLNPVMDEARVERLSGPYGKSMRPNERLASGMGGSGSTACPTCGGK